MIRREILSRLAVLAFWLSMLAASSLSLRADEGVSDQMLDAQEAFEQERYTEAIERFKALLTADGPDASILYNLGVCYRKQGDLSNTILMLERAMLLEPTRRDIRHALADAYRSTKDVQAQVTEPPMSDFDGLAYLFGLSTWGVVALLSFLVSMFGFFVFRIMPVLKWRKRVFYASLSFLVVCLGANALIAHQVYYHKARLERVIIVKDVALMSQPNTEARPTGKLSEGSAVRMLVQDGDWYEVTSQYGHRGWVRQEAIEFVQPI